MLDGERQEVKEGRQSSPDQPEEKTEPSLPHRNQSVNFLRWLISFVTVMVLIGLIWHIQNLRQSLNRQGQEIARLSKAIMGAKTVFLERADNELGYADVDLEAGNRHQFRFRLDEALRWLKDAEKLLVENERQHISQVIREIEALPSISEKDTTTAKQRLATARDKLAQLITNRTSGQ